MVSIRKAVTKDIPRILELYRQLSLSPDADAPDPSPEEYHRAFNEIRDVPNYELLVAEEDDEILGTTVLAILPGMAHSAASFAVLEYFVVDEKRRRRGIGRALMDYCIARARETGCYKIMLTSDKRRKEAHKFYESLGFEASAHGFRLYF